VRILVVGAGEVGSSIAASLADTHEIVVVDIDKERVDSLTYAYDVLAVQGDGTDIDVLEDAEVEAADLVIASTDDDETNLATCGTVKTLTEAFTIARVQKTAYLRTWRRSHDAFDVDFMVCTDLLAAQAIVRVIGLPTARDVDLFAEGRVQMAEFEVPEGSPVANQTIQEADRFDALTFAAILRNGDAEIARGDSVIGVGDNVVVIGIPESVEEFAATVAPEGTTGAVDDIVLIGGSSMALQTAQLLEDRGFRPTLLIGDPEHARYLAERLPRTTVMDHDPTDLEFLEREFIGEADMAISSLETDERSLLGALLAKRVGAERTVAVVDNAAYVDLFEAVGVDVAVNPREVTAEEITRFTRERRAENVAIIEPGLAEVLEFEVADESMLVGRAIKDAVSDLPEGVVFGAITRAGQYVTPRGDTVIEPQDHVVLFVREEAASEVTDSI
jgi:trk system potassium uptake protein TrkA